MVLVHRREHEIGGLGPAHVAQHHLARQDHRARVDLVEVGVLRRRAVGRLEHRVAGHVVDVAARRDADAADLGGEGVGQVVAVQVHRRDDVEVLGARQHLLQRDVGDGVLDEDAAGRERLLLLVVGRGVALGGAGALPLVPGVGLGRELLLREGVAPVPEGALGELHDVALVDEGEALALVGDGVLDRGAHEPLGALARDRLDADAARLREADLAVDFGNCSFMNARTFAFSAEPASNSMPA